ncbi:protein involved in sex pheromone biosynthesis [Virgibacillus halotolerans]|uniref:CamS family sex pheromone protein n=1 Tax=Virgibacillus halotolerans TaxID=1071053 RepID=UPI00195FBFD3|nr:CamS family sex pheromone protein [Virgibacillus halotolerans]MBM7601119.1 protein involved in sex pheromone biosynthesis [Virgibacillus halotolerans]
MKKISIWLIGTLLFITGCGQDMSEDEVVQKDESNEEVSIVPSQQLSNDNYKTVLPYKPSQARGIIVDQVANRLDIDEMEEGLRRHSQDQYDPSDYYFQEGQYITEDMVLEWIDELNPEVKKDSGEKEYRDNPRYLSHILEQNYLHKQKDGSTKLAGISIGLAMKSVYRFQTEVGGPYYYEKISKDEMMKKGQEIADNIVKEMREIEGLEDIPIMVALYQEEEQSSPVPGNFVAKANASGGDTSVGKWENIKEEHILFPSKEGKEKYFDDHEVVKNFGNEIATYFPNYVGVIGEGLYIDGDLQKLTLEIPIEFYGKGEVIGFSQYAYGLVQEMFKNYYDLEINVTSSNEKESLIYREANEDAPTIHIFH